VNWMDCYATDKVVGINLVDPVEALHALMAKCFLKALLPQASNLPMLKHEVLQLRPQVNGTWLAMTQWSLLHKLSI